MSKRPEADPGIEVGGTTHSPPDHREKAVEAAAEAQFQRDGTTPLWPDAKERMRTEYREDAETVLESADPHLRRAHFEEFRAAMLCEASVAAGKKRLPLQGEVREKVPRILEVALDKAQELLEGEDD